MVSWDPRTPVSVTQIGKYTITIYDMAAYEQSQIDYPDDPDNEDTEPRRSTNGKPQFVKKKPAARWNWIVKPEQPLGKIVQEKGMSPL
jgi:hypothetical protein